MNKAGLRTVQHVSAVRRTAVPVTGRQLCPRYSSLVKIFPILKPLTSPFPRVTFPAEADGAHL